MSKITPLIEYRGLYENGRDRQANDVLLRTVTALIDADDTELDLRDRRLRGLRGGGDAKCVGWMSRDPYGNSG